MVRGKAGTDLVSAAGTIQCKRGPVERFHRKSTERIAICIRVSRSELAYCVGVQGSSALWGCILHFRVRRVEVPLGSHCRFCLCAVTWAGKCLPRKIRQARVARMGKAVGGLGREKNVSHTFTSIMIRRV